MYAECGSRFSITLTVLWCQVSTWAGPTAWNFFFQVTTGIIRKCWVLFLMPSSLSLLTIHMPRQWLPLDEAISPNDELFTNFKDVCFVSKKNWNWSDTYKVIMNECSKPKMNANSTTQECSAIKKVIFSGYWKGHRETMSEPTGDIHTCFRGKGLVFVG